uniref:Chitin-binding type-2 domain-containing protein n=1 Tax=Anopheles stephensi TaxID=30069 RepID=A0A182YFD9_ANOST
MAFAIRTAISVVLCLLMVDALQLAVNEGCPKATRPHMTRCDQYYRCTVLSKDAHVWVATQCQKGLVYLHHLGTCVVPDNDWECDVSAENERNHSDENVYGIDNLNVPASLATNSNSASEESSSASKEESMKSNDSPQSDLNDMESSGDGSPERVNDEPNHTAASASNITIAPAGVTTSTTLSSGTLSSSMLDSFLSYYDTQNALKLKTKQQSPPKMDEKNYLDHLKQIVSQQKQLNEMARIPSQMDMFNYKSVPVQQLTAKKEPVVDEPLSKLNLSPGMQDIIKSILDISQKAIANQKPPADAPSPAPEVKDPVVKPIFIPISVNPVPAPSVQTPPTTEQPVKAQYPASYGMELSGPPSLRQNTVQNSLRIPEANDTQFNVFPQQVLYDAYGNSDRVKLLESIDSIDADGVQDGSLEKDLPLPANRHSVDMDDDVSGENGDTDSANSQYTRKLFTLGDMTFDYEQYKDSMLPLVDANPDDERISIVLCMVGSRQPNNTDCFRYYICNPHNGVFQSYTCPPTTAFNKKSRMCDIASYKQCKQLMTPPAPPRAQLRTRKQPQSAKQSVTQINQIKQELLKAQKYVELIRLEASKLRQHNRVPASSSQQVIYLPSMGGQTPVRENTRVKQKAEVSKKKKRPSIGTKRITAATATAKPTQSVPRCRLEGRMADPMDKSNYYVCHRKNPNKFIKIKMACPANLLYCADTQYCTLSTNC